MATANTNKQQGPSSKSAGLVYQGMDGRTLLAQGFTVGHEPTGPYHIVVDKRQGRKPQIEVVHAQLATDADYEAFMAAMQNARERLR